MDEMQNPDIVNNFRENFYTLVQQIPEGKITTYGALARALGDIRAARAVGKMLNENPRPIVVPCHRVVMSDGSIGGFGMGVDKKIELLEDEGIKVKNDKIVDFKEKLFEDFDCDAPLEKLREEQLSIRDEVVIEDELEEYEVVGGVDVSYTDSTAYGSISIWDEEGEIDTLTIKTEISFPYISTYLSFRELPVLVELMERLKETDMEEPDVLMVDGNGILHPFKIGLASHLGVELDMPTIGVAKSMLTGRMEKEVTHEDPLSKIYYTEDENELIGYAYLSSSRAKNPIYVSPGHRVTPETALEKVKMYCEYKIPQPVRKAHIQANKKRREDE